MWFRVGRSDTMITMNRGLLRCVFQCPNCTFSFHYRQTDPQCRVGQPQAAHLQGIQVSTNGSQPYTCSKPALGGSLHRDEFCHLMPMQCHCHLAAAPELQFQCCNKWIRDLRRFVKGFNYLKLQSGDPIPCQRFVPRPGCKALLSQVSFYKCIFRLDSPQFCSETQELGSF